MHRSDALSGSPIDRRVAALANRQHGVVSIAQLSAAGVGRGAIALRVRGARLHRVHHGVYAAGHARLTLRGRYWAAVLACGGPDAAALSHRTAAAIWDLLPPPNGKLDVTTLGRSESMPGLRVHRGATVHGDVVRQADGLTVTSPTRTLIDLADVLTPHQLTRTCHRAEILRALDAKAIAARLAELPGRRATTLRRALATLTHADPQQTRSELEERFLSLTGQYRLPPPRTNATVLGHVVDFLWPAERLIVETDGAATHNTLTAFRNDRRRDLALKLAGYEVIRLTWDDVVHEPDATARAVRTLLTRSR
jgi:very-short-patch-repair endonuclease